MGTEPASPTPGDEPEDEGPAAPWLPPDDRLWRHPSEVRSNPATRRESPMSSAARRVRQVDARMWVVSVSSGVIGALVSASILLAAGALSTPAAVPTTLNRDSTATLGLKAGPSPPNVTAVLDMVEPSVVGVSVNGAQGDETGSGVIVSTSGGECYVLTDNALFSEAGPNNQISVASYWGAQQTGHLVGTDASAGLAVVRVGPLPYTTTADLGSVADIQTGEEVFSVGSLSVAGASNGSNFAPGYINDDSSYLQPVNGASNAMFSMLVANMALAPTEFGGALVDSTGEVLGITSPVPGQLGQSGLTFVTPIDTAMADVASMIKNGPAVAHPWLGILQATDISGPGAQKIGLAGAVQVDTVASGSPAAAAGIADNDVVTALDGRPVSSVGALIAWLANATPGQVTSVQWLHNGHPRKANVTLGKQPATASPS